MILVDLFSSITDSRHSVLQSVPNTLHFGGRVAEGIRDEGQKSTGSEASLIPLITDQFVYRKVLWFVCCLPYKGEQLS